MGRDNGEQMGNLGRELVRKMERVGKEQVGGWENWRRTGVQDGKSGPGTGGQG